MCLLQTHVRMHNTRAVRRLVANVETLEKYGRRVSAEDGMDVALLFQ